MLMFQFVVKLVYKSTIKSKSCYTYIVNWTVYHLYSWEEQYFKYWIMGGRTNGRTLSVSQVNRGMILFLWVIDNNNQTAVYHELRFVLKANVVRVAWSLVFCLMFCTTLFVPLSFCHLVVVLSGLRFAVSVYPFGIFKLL